MAGLRLRQPGLKRLDESRAWSAQAAQLAERTGETETMSLFFGPTNVNFWRIGIEVDGGDPARALDIARSTYPATIAAGCRQVFYYADVGRAYARLRGKDREAIRFLLTAERIAPSTSIARRMRGRPRGYCSSDHDSKPVVRSCAAWASACESADRLNATTRRVRIGHQRRSPGG